MSASNPLSTRCVAKAKSTGERCKRWVPGSGVCQSHGQSKKVRAAQQARALALQAQLEAGEREPSPPRHPIEVLLSAIDGSDQVMLQLRRDFAAGRLSPDLHRAYGEALDRSGRLAKLALDARTDERLVKVAESQAQKLIAVMDRCMSDARVAVVGDPREVIRDALRELNDPAPGLRAPGLRVLPAAE